jgi:hypothetical protein
MRCDAMRPGCNADGLTLDQNKQDHQVSNSLLSSASRLSAAGQWSTAPDVHQLSCHNVLEGAGMKVHKVGGWMNGWGGGWVGDECLIGRERTCSTPYTYLLAGLDGAAQVGQIGLDR